jgi:3-hydroxyisobutyrate dehydrogenase
VATAVSADEEQIVTSIGFVGIGRMGERMAARLAGAGFTLKLHDLDSQRADAVAARIGAASAVSLSTIAECEMVITMLPTSADVQEVLLRAEDGAFLRHARHGTIVIDMGSSEPAATRETGLLLAEIGVAMIDAPVSGGVMRAEDGTLAIMVGADDEAALAKAMPVLEALGARIFRLGRLGAGDAMKAANNYAAAATYAATAEALAMGKSFGLDPAQMVEVMNMSTGRSFVTEVVMKEHVVTRTFATGFGLALLTKDVGIAAGLAQDLGLDAPMARLVHERMKLAVAMRGDRADHSEAILGWYGELWEEPQ